MQELVIESRDLDLQEGRTGHIRQAVIGDLEQIRGLYFKTYGDRYTISEIANIEHTKRALNNRQNYLWIVSEVDGRIVGSVIFTVDPYHRLGKAFSGVIESEFRGHRLIYLMMEEGHRCLLKEGGACDLIYAVVRTFVSTSFHENLNKLGYVDTGIFPNVRKLSDYETHGFKICPAPHAFTNRRSALRIVNQAQTLCRLVSNKFNFPQAIVKNIQLPKAPNKRVKLFEHSPEEYPLGIEKEREKLRQEGKLRFGFYPCQEPNIMLVNEDRTIKVFINYQQVDGNASLLGLETGGMDMVDLLESISYKCEKMQVKYLEVLASAYDPLIQAQLWQAYFMPSAWFPAARLAQDKQREDYIIASRTFVPLHFKGLKLTEESKPFLLEYYKLYTSRLWEELVDA